MTVTGAVSRKTGGRLPGGVEKLFLAASSGGPGPLTLQAGYNVRTVLYILRGLISNASRQHTLSCLFFSHAQMSLGLDIKRRAWNLMKVSGGPRFSHGSAVSAVMIMDSNGESRHLTVIKSQVCQPIIHDIHTSTGKDLTAVW